MQRKWMITGAIGALTLAVGGIAVAQSRTDNDGPRMGRLAAMLGDANGDGTITKAEAVAASEAHFARMDVNKDGKIDKADREAMRARRQDAWFAKIDTDKNGQLSKPELAAGREAREDAAPPAPGDDMRGSGKDGRDGRGRGGRFGRGHGGPGMGGVGMMGRMADTDKDGVISHAEFVAAGQAMFARADTNSDGTISAAELQAARATMKGRWGGRHGGPDAQPGN